MTDGVLTWGRSACACTTCRAWAPAASSACSPCPTSRRIPTPSPASPRAPLLSAPFAQFSSGLQRILSLSPGKGCTHYTSSLSRACASSPPPEGEQPATINVGSSKCSVVLLGCGAAPHPTPSSALRITACVSHAGGPPSPRGLARYPADVNLIISGDRAKSGGTVRLWDRRLNRAAGIFGSCAARSRASPPYAERCKSRESNVRISGGRSLTRPFRDARRFRSPGL